MHQLPVARQGGGYGRDAGELVFERQSECGNGRITVTAHAAFPASERAGAGEEQWRVLRFNDATRQSVARVAVRRSAGGAAREGPETGSASSVGLCLEAQPRCLAADYLKTVASAGAGFRGSHAYNLTWFQRFAESRDMQGCIACKLLSY